MEPSLSNGKDMMAGSLQVQTPRDAATIIIVDDNGSELRVLMGRRRRDQVFLPGKFVFPGGRVDATDAKAESADELHEREVLKLLYRTGGQPSRTFARSIALAGIREVFEETGIVIGQKTGVINNPALTGWQEFFNTGYRPALSGLRFFARAVTPPGLPRRYDTRFFCVPSRSIGLDTGQCDGELEDIGWYTISEACLLDLIPVTRLVLDDLKTQIAGVDTGATSCSVTYYTPQNGALLREEVDVKEAS